MTPMDRQARAAGGTARKEKLDDWERAFVGMLGGSKRPITKDRRPTPEQVVSELRQEGVKEQIPWSIYVAVGMDGKMVRSALSRPEQVKAVQQMGEVAGFAGLILFNREWRTYTRRLLLSPIAQSRLDAACGFFNNHVKEFEKRELQRRGLDASNALLSAQVYIDPAGDTCSVFYSFHPDHFPEPGSIRVGLVYLVNAADAAGHYDVAEGDSPWLVRWHLEDPKSAEFAAIMKDAEQRFKKVVKTFYEMQRLDFPKGQKPQSSTK
jgi:hypothetical protein